MIIEVKQWPDSQEVMDNPDWFFIMDGNPDSRYSGSNIGDSAYGRILDESEYILIKDIKEKYTFSEYVNFYSCPKCKPDQPVHTVKDLSDGSWHEIKDGSTTIIPDPFKKKKKNDMVDVKDSEIRMNLLLSTFSEEISISEKMELIQNMITELKHVRRLLQDLKKEGTHVE